jgi:hypothetical protein
MLTILDPVDHDFEVVVGEGAIGLQGVGRAVGGAGDEVEFVAVQPGGQREAVTGG